MHEGSIIGLGRRVQEYSSEAPHAKTLAVLRDPAPGGQRTAQYLSWIPDGSRKIAVAYCVMEFQVWHSVQHQKRSSERLQSAIPLPYH